jgi:hypothetical protein
MQERYITPPGGYILLLCPISPSQSLERIAMNYFNYFTEIEDRFQQRRGSLLMLSTLDWALIETWREAGVPLEAVLRGIDDAFDKHDAKVNRASARRPRKVNGLAWCAQAILEAVEQSREAAIGTSAPEPRDSGFDAARIATYLNRNAAQVEAAAQQTPAVIETATRLRTLATLLSSRSEAEGSASQPATNLEEEEISLKNEAPSLEELDRTLTVLEEKLYTSLLAAAPEDQLVALRAQADRELAPYRGKMQSVQIKQVQQQLLQKRLLEAHSLPRLSLFYMPHEEEA